MPPIVRGPTSFDPSSPAPDFSLPRPRRRVSGLAISVLLHALALGLLVWRHDAIWSRAAAPGLPLLPLGGGGGGGGGPRVTYITLPPVGAPALAVTPPALPPPVVPKEVVPPKEEVPRPEPVAVTPTPAADTVPTTVAHADTSGEGTGADSGSGAGVGPGRGPGTGAGEGPGAGPGTGPGTGGAGGTIAPPVIRAFSMPWESPPKPLRGAVITVTWWVRADGTVERVETAPPIEDDEYRRKFLDVTLGVRFRPARTPDGRAVPGTYAAQYALPTK